VVAHGGVMCVVSIIRRAAGLPDERRFINEEQLAVSRRPRQRRGARCRCTPARRRPACSRRGCSAPWRCWRAVQALVSDGWMNLVQFKLLRMDQWAGMKEPWVFHERLDTYY